MTTTFRPAFALVFVPLLALPTACGDAPDVRMDSSGDEAAADALPDRYAITTRDGDVKLGLTDEEVYVRLSDEVLEEARREMAEETEDQEGLAGAIASRVTSAVSQALSARMAYDVSNVDRAVWEDGELRLYLESGERAWQGMQVDDRPLGEQFEREEALRFIQAFEEVKAAR